MSERASQTEILCACTDSCAKDAEIERLTAENERLASALEPFAEEARWAQRNGHDLTSGWSYIILRGNDVRGHAGVQPRDCVAAFAALPQHQHGAEGG